MSRRLATVDVGSNSVTGLVAEEAADGRWRPLWQGTRITRLGGGMGPDRRLSRSALARTVEALEWIASRARSLGAEALVGVATAAAREAVNGDALVAGAAGAGVHLRIVSGDEEAGLSWLASWRDFGGPGVALTVIDVGGRSTEVIHGAGERYAFRTSLAVGSVRLMEATGHLGDAPPEAALRTRAAGAVDEALAPLPPAAPRARIVAVAGTATTLAAIHLRLARYDPDRVHGAELTAAEVESALDRLWHLDLPSRRALPGMEPDRADVLPFGALILSRTLRHLGGGRVTVSDRGVRWGLLHEEAARHGLAPPGG